MLNFKNLKKHEFDFLRVKTRQFLMRRKVLEGLGNVTCVECQYKMFLEERPDGSMLYRCKTCRKTIAYRDLAQLLHGKRDNDLENALEEEIVKELIETYSQM